MKRITIIALAAFIMLGGVGGLYFFIGPQNNSVQESWTSGDSFISLKADGTYVSFVDKNWGAGKYTIQSNSKLILTDKEGSSKSGVYEIAKSQDNREILFSTETPEIVFQRQSENNESVKTVDRKRKGKPVKIIYRGNITAQGFSQSMTLTLKTDFTEASINGPMTPLAQSSQGVYTWTEGTITGMSIRPDNLRCSLYNFEGDLMGTLYKASEELADGTQITNFKRNEIQKCGNESSARQGVDGFLSDKGYNQLAGEYEAKIIEMRPISACSFTCKVQIKSYQDPMGYDAVNRSFKVEWSDYESKYIVTGSF
jgi:hypothetical protein